MHNLDEFPEVARDHFRSFGRPFGEVVVSFIDDHCARAVGDHDAIRILIEVGKLGASKASIDHIERLHIRNERVPKSKTGTAGENDAAGFGRLHSILLLKLTNRRLPPLPQYTTCHKGAHAKTS